MLFAIENLENPEEVCHFQDIMNRPANSEQEEVLLQVPRLLQRLDQRGDAGAVDIPDRAHIQRKPGSRLQGF